MKTLSTYLWKEWREQRATLGVLAVVLFAGVAAVVAVLPAKHADDPLVFQGAIAIALLATIMSTGSDLLARERSGAGLGFLERAPAGLAMAFRAKLVFFALALTSAAMYGAVLATAAALLRSGELPQYLLDGPSPWLLAILLGVSVWVFAVSAWMPASALTFPGTVLLLAALAWPAVLAMQGDPLYKPTPAQGLAFALLCLAGAPTSAWAAFVLGSRRGRSRRWASIAGLSVAAIFFAPAWAWAAARYSSLVNAPFDVLGGWVGPNGRFAFLNLVRRPPPGVSDMSSNRWDRTTALLVDLEQHSWRFSGEIDGSAFASESGRRRLLPEYESCSPLRLLDQLVPSIGTPSEVLIDRNTSQVTRFDDLHARAAQQLSPRDFGVEQEPRSYWIQPAGLGHALHYSDGKRMVRIYRDPVSLRVFNARDLPLGATGRPFLEVRIRPGRWIVRDWGRWVWLDPLTGRCDPLENLAKEDRMGPWLEDGRALVVSGSDLWILDLDHGGRVAVHIIGDDRFRVRGVTWAMNPFSPLPSREAVVVTVNNDKHSRLALLDVRSQTLRVGESNEGAGVELLWSRPPAAIILENGERIINCDLSSGARELMFDVNDVD